MSESPSTDKAASLAKKPLATCLLCRKRKIKCDRTDPCAHCVHAGITCARAPPARLPRGRQGGRRKVDSELLQRIAKLENMVKELDGTNTTPPAQAVKTSTRPPATNVESNFDRMTLTSTHRASSDASGSTGLERYMAPSVWVTLGEEINGMREILDQPSDSEDDDSEPATGSALSPATSQTSTTLFGHSPANDSTPLSHPPAEGAKLLCEIYLANVDPVLKILHAPSVRDYFLGITQQLACSPGAGGLDALRFAMYYAAVTSMSPNTCMQRLGEEQSVLLNRYHAGLRIAFARADLLQTEETSTLQALTIYLVVLRCHDPGRTWWTLLATAIRIGQALGLNRELCYTSLSVFHQQMRRRLWWALAVLDSHASGDRGSERILGADSFDTKLPLRINDTALRVDSMKEPIEPQEYTDMTFNVMCQHVFDTFRCLNYTDTSKTGASYASDDPWRQRREMVMAARQQVEAACLRFCNPSIDFQCMTAMVADVITATMWLAIYRPLQPVLRKGMSKDIPYPGILHLAVEVLEKATHIFTGEVGAEHVWNSKTYVQWHPLSVALAELCVHVEGPTVERAWSIVPRAVEQVRENIADGDKGQLWRPIKKLLSKAQAVRRDYLMQSMNNTVPLQADTGNIVNMPTHPNAFMAGLEYFDQPMQTPVVFPNSTGNTNFVPDLLPQNWDPLVGITFGDERNVSDTTYQAGWDNWEMFVKDFQATGEYGII